MIKLDKAPVRVWGYSDDLVEIENSEVECEVDCYDSTVDILFRDGTEIEVGYSKPGIAVWWIKVIKEGNAQQNLIICENEMDECYSDLFEIDSEIERIVVRENK